MFSKEQRRVAIETFIKFDHSYSDTAEQGAYYVTAWPVQEREN